MANSKFNTGGLEGLIENNQNRQEEQAAPQKPVRNKSINPVRSSLILPEDLMEKLKIISVFKRTTMKDIIEDLVRKEVASYEKKHGNINF